MLGGVNHQLPNLWRFFSMIGLVDVGLLPKTKPWVWFVGNSQAGETKRSASTALSCCGVLLFFWGGGGCTEKIGLLVDVYQNDGAF